MPFLQPNPRYRTPEDLSPVDREHYEVGQGLKGWVSRADFLSAYRRQYPDRSKGSILPSDYCFARNNKGNARHPRFLEWRRALGYRFVGLNPSGTAQEPTQAEIGGNEGRTPARRIKSNLSFTLRFPATQVPHWARRYAYADDAEVIAIGRCAKERGHFTKLELPVVCRWKTPRSQSRVASNDASEIEEITRIARTTSSERVRISTLTLLHGVAWPTASVLLHLAHRDPYPILDYRALWSLGIDEPPSEYTFPFWWEYVQRCRELASAAEVDMRTLDQALWQYSKEHQ